MKDQYGQIVISCCSKQWGSRSVMDDAFREIQETGHEQQPARMVGLFSLDSGEFSPIHPNSARMLVWTSARSYCGRGGSGVEQW